MADRLPAELLMKILALVDTRRTPFRPPTPHLLRASLVSHFWHRQHIRLWQCRFQAPQLPPVFPNLLSLSLSQSSIPFEMAARLFHPDALPSLRSLVLDFADIRDAPTPHIIFHPALLVRLDLFQLNSHLYSKESASLVPPLLGPPFPVLVTFHPYALEHLTRDPNLHGIEHLN
ncbi:hypothetical protein JCM6882_006613 [Rhodosporidiobolus microsporus]